jgi:hypothetical protein
MDESNQNLSQLGWSEDGQLLAISSVTGVINVYLTKLPLLASVCSHRIAFMTSLKEISVYDHLSKTKVNYKKIFDCNFEMYIFIRLFLDGSSQLINTH